MLRLAVAPRGALEVAHEGPEIGARSALRGRVRAEIGPAGSGSPCSPREGCGMCRVLAPAIAAFGAHPAWSLRTFDEVARRRRVGGRRRAGQPVRGRARRRRHGAGQGHVQHRRAAGVRARRRRAPARSGARVSEGARIADAVAAASSRRGFLARVGAAVMGVAGARTVGSLVAPGEAEAYHFCGHIYTTDSLPAPDRAAADRRQGPPAEGRGRPAASTTSAATSTPPARRSTTTARRSTDADGAPLPSGDAHAGLRRRRRPSYGFKPHIDGAWYRCCGGHVRKLVDCCGYVHNRDQRRQGADRLLLQRPQGVLRHVLRHEGQVLTAVADRRRGRRRA